MNKVLRLTLGAAAIAVALASVPTTSNASLVNLGPGSFTPLAPEITFDEQPVGTINPVYNFLAVPGLGNETVSFAGTFMGQTVTPGPVVTLINHLPTGPLALNAAGPQTQITNDGAPGATSPILSGSPIFNGPISVLFSTPVAAVGLKGGYFDNAHSTSIEAYDATGASLGILSNSVTGFEFYGLADASGQNVISGISFYVTGDEPAGFEIDDLTFGAAQAVVGTVPESPTWMLAGIGLLGLGALRIKRG